MASPTRTLTVNFVGRTKNLDRSFKRVAKGSELMSEKLMRATRVAGVGFAALGGVVVGTAMALKPMIDKASDVQESLSKNNVVFGESAKAVEQFAERSLQAFGVTRRQALEATGVIGTLGATMGMAEADSADMATTLVGLAGDMASFNNASIDETLTAIQAGLRGENEPLRRFGVLLDAATLKAKALQEGIIKSTKEALTPQAKALAAYALILEQTGIQMGDFERTSDGAANQQRLLAGAWDDLQVQIGEKLLPQFTRLVVYANTVLVPAMQRIIDINWSEFTFGDLELAIADATEGMTAFLVETGVTLGLDIRQGLIDTFLSAQTEVGTREALTDMLHNALTKAGGVRMVTGAIEGLWHAIFGDGTEATKAFEERMKDLLTRFDEGLFTGGRDDPDFDRGEEFPKSIPDAGFGALGSVAAIENAIANAAAAAEAALAAAAAADQAAIAEGERIADAAAAKAAAAAAAEQERLAGLSGEDITGTGPGLVEVANAGGAAAGGISEAERLAIEAWLGSPGAQAMFGNAGAGPQTVVNINAGAVSGQEVVEAIGKYVDDNGPLPPHWQQSAN